MRYRTFSEADYPAMQALDLTLQRQDPAFDSLPERERDGRLHTSQPALKFYERSEHSFVAEEGDTLAGFILAQPVWQGDRPLVLVRTVSVLPGAPEGTSTGLLHAAVKSAYDTAVYEVHFTLTPDLLDAATSESAVVTGQSAVCHLGTRADTAPGTRLRSVPANPAPGTPEQGA
ncbi:DUF1999 domain-containing protein [Deinococcus aquaticus]|uniref:DUF1999 domain-containing protein n=1 Tax=Deinococcus aquaticus TaxID=328692 RepID=UPI003F46C765